MAVSPEFAESLLLSQRVISCLTGVVFGIAIAVR